MKQKGADRSCIATAMMLAIIPGLLLAGTVTAGTQLTPACDPDSLPPGQAQQCRQLRLKEGQRLFDEETFDGNGRTCVTCHSPQTGTFSPKDVERRLRADAADPLFLHDGLDDGFSGTSRIEHNATVRITLPLPGHLSLADDPQTQEITLFRGTPSTLNTPALDPALMSDLRDPNLNLQALGAINAHGQATREPTELELDLIAEFQRIDSRFFSDGRLKQFARTGVAPELPLGETESEQRGRRFFIDVPFQPPSADGVCALCHSGPMLNTTNVFAPAAVGSPPGSRLQSVGVSERNKAGNPEYTFLVHDPFGPPVAVTTPDIGVLMSDFFPGSPLSQWIPPIPVMGALGIRLAFFANRFKTPTLWGVKHTAPYYHDNSAADLDEMLEQYDWFFENNARINANGPFELSDQDKEDIKAFLRLL